VEARVWLAKAEDVDAVSSLIAAFRDWWGKDKPALDQIRETAAVLLADPATDFLLAARDGEDAEAVCQLRYRLSVWTGADDCWLEDLFVGEAARRGGLGRALVAAAIERARQRGCRRIEPRAALCSFRAPSEGYACAWTVLGGEVAVPCHPQSALAGLNPRPRGSAFGASTPDRGVDGRVPRGERSRTRSDPGGSSLKRYRSCAADQPGRSR
jgi:GNAT superfamily N-acetyltransferase